jgi:hypothetical protein
MMIVVALLVQGLAAAGVSGVVVDPHDLPVPNARVTLTCEGRAAVVASDQAGRFLFTGDVSGNDCTLTGEHDGFAAARLTLHAVRDRGLTVTLRLPMKDLAAAVTVSADQPRASFLSLSLAEDDFRTLAGTTADAIRQAQLLAGATSLRSVIYVDGLPSPTLPSLDMVARITVNADPFSAEYAHGDLTAIHLFTKAPARTFRFHSGSDAIGFGGRNVLSDSARADTVAGNFGVSGPIPRVPFTFAITGSASRAVAGVPIIAALPEAPVEEEVEATQRYHGGTIDVQYAGSNRPRVRLWYRDTSASSDNIGVGGLMLADAGSSSRSRTQDVRATISRTIGDMSYEGGLVASRMTSTARANANTIGLSVAGAFVSGGASHTGSASRQLAWTAKNVVRFSGARPWSAGLVVNGSSHLNDQTPNASGHLYFDSLEAYAANLAGQGNATLFVTRGDGRVHYSGVHVSPFVHKVLIRTAAVEVNGGLRADYQRGFTAIVSPRLSMATSLNGYNISLGTGLFARPIPNFVIINAIANDGQHLQRFLARNVLVGDIAAAALLPQTSVRTRLAEDMANPREWMHRVSVERAFGRLVPALEYTWSHERRLLGSQRVREDGGLVDTVMSNRAATRHRVHAQTRYVWRRQQVAAHYEWVRARDNTDGPMSFPTRPDTAQDEWAPSAGIAPHNVSVVASLALPGAISIHVNETWNSRVPYDVTTGLDRFGMGLYNDRDGRPRNSGEGPRFHALSLYGYRRVTLPDVLVPGPRRLHLNVGVQVNNVLDNKNYLSVGSVVGSPSFGRPLAAYPGRSVRVFLNID